MSRDQVAALIAGIGLLVVILIALRIRRARRQERGDRNLRIDLTRRD